MRHLVLSDIHGNLTAFSAVLEDAGEFDDIWCLGDVIGYGPQPNECIEKLMEYSYICVAGNHDWAAIGKLDVDSFNPDALQACLWTRNQLTHSSRAFVDGLPETLEEGSFTLVHGSPREPIWEYITHAEIAEGNLEYFRTTFCFVGHTHIPAVFAFTAGNQRCEELSIPLGEPVLIGPDRWLINPGGVGQPRDGDPRASYMILDSEHNTIEHRRVDYPIAETQRLMAEFHLPSRLANRLMFGW